MHIYKSNKTGTNTYVSRYIALQNASRTHAMCASRSESANLCRFDDFAWSHSPTPAAFSQITRHLLSGLKRYLFQEFFYLNCSHKCCSSPQAWMELLIAAWKASKTTGRHTAPLLSMELCAPSLSRDAAKGRTIRYLITWPGLPNHVRVSINYGFGRWFCIRNALPTRMLAHFFRA